MRALTVYLPWLFKILPTKLLHQFLQQPNNFKMECFFYKQAQVSQLAVLNTSVYVRLCLLLTLCLTQNRHRLLHTGRFCPPAVEFSGDEFVKLFPRIKHQQIQAEQTCHSSPHFSAAVSSTCFHTEQSAVHHRAVSALGLRHSYPGACHGSKNSLFSEKNMNLMNS